MPKRIKKSFQFYLSKMKKHSSPHIDLSSKTFASSKGWILRGCKHPKTPSFSVNNNNVKKSTFTTNEDVDSAATLADIDRFLSENFKSLYLRANDDERDVDDGKGKHISKQEIDKNDIQENPGCLMFESPRCLNLPPNKDGPHNRFFINRTSSGSLIEEARTSMTSSTMPSSSSDETRENETNKITKHTKTNQGPEDFITLLTFSMDPCDDFRHSMLEMIEARLEFNGKVDWEFMEELLFCYLNLNDKKSYKFILNAFVDLNVILRERLGDRVPVKSRNVGRGRRRRVTNQMKCNV
ncbi:hypothetical protein LIER_39426 [Lithospermum erythrorhizon]|uniref:Transcription repressor n=1 Tax=Lithospermum erythrorhizon TaxID=34254 RepID=A0AAV3QHP2_LITER